MTERRQSSGNGEEEPPRGVGLRPSPAFWWWPAPSPTRRKSGKVEDLGALDSARCANPSFGQAWDELERWGATRIAYQYELEARLGKWGSARMPAYPFCRPFSMLHDREYLLLKSAVAGSDWLNEDPRRAIKGLPAVRMGHHARLPEDLANGNAYESGWIDFCGWKLRSSDRLPRAEKAVAFSVNLAMSDRFILEDLKRMITEDRENERDGIGLPDGGFDQFMKALGKIRRDRGITLLRGRVNVAGAARDRGPEFAWSAVQALDEMPASRRCMRTYEARKKMLQRAKRDWRAWRDAIGSPWCEALELGRRLLVDEQV